MNKRFQTMQKVNVVTSDTSGLSNVHNLSSRPTRFSLRVGVITTISLFLVLASVFYHGESWNINMKHQSLLLASLILLPATLFMGSTLDPSAPRRRQWLAIAVTAVLNFGLSFLVFQEHQADHSMVGWNEARGVVTNVEVASDEVTSVHRDYQVDVTYQAGTGVTFSETLTRQMIMNRGDNDAYQKGQRVSVFYNPQSPAEAVLSKDEWVDGIFSGTLRITELAAGCSLAVAICVGFWFALMRKGD